MINIIKNFLRYWNEPLHPPTEEDIADLEAMQQLMDEIKALEHKTGKKLICRLPEVGCGL